MSSGRAVVLVRDQADAQLVRVALPLGPTTVVCFGPSDPAGVLAGARAAGAVRALRVWDERLADSDSLGIAHALAAAVRAAADGDLANLVIVCGERRRAAMGPALAERLGLLHLGHVVACERSEGKLLVRRHAGGVIRLYAGTAPVVLCLSAAPDEPLSGVGEVEARTLTELGLSAAELAYRRRFRPVPRPGPVPRPLHFDDVTALCDRLRADGVLRRPEES